MLHSADGNHAEVITIIAAIQSAPRRKCARDRTFVGVDVGAGGNVQRLLFVHSQLHIAEATPLLQCIPRCSLLV